ncbi:LysE family translocator [Moritella viscosa]|uniref:Lysine exporter protein (LYSE/YGGA) n=1 Tax=Moritella viscosa TaxID=80854 RepID=A0ABY1HCB6_9GAMM|nr:LysE family translocator [Moritella viscosa]SGY89196.1 Lysine exporter protein (LYSE/YGGA) [Moritella viscosa]SGY93058.1 Lysine exporter protein (LYSE/YGGA) [Moritella viscosa]SGY97071.1 Lysine exporter protein (LYSE/YGGA) [Moritella viscosa]SHO25780.1 Lysine exporter protein (LYSE/YGGA) [Moritella viscosa]
MDIGYWVMFLTASLALNMTPGPDLIFVLTKTVSHGRKAGIVAAAGVCSGALVHVAAAALGLSAIIVSSAYAFMLIKIIGVGYLIYLAWQAFTASGGVELTSTDRIDGDSPSPMSHWKVFKQGVLIDVLNPKAAIFFMAFLPQFVREGQGTVSMQLLLLGMIVVIGAFVVELGYIFAAHRLTKKVKGNQSFTLWLNRTVGTVFVALGVKLAAT